MTVSKNQRDTASPQVQSESSLRTPVIQSSNSGISYLTGRPMYRHCAEYSWYVGSSGEGGKVGSVTPWSPLLGNLEIVQRCSLIQDAQMSMNIFIDFL